MYNLWTGPFSKFNQLDQIHFTSASKSCCYYYSESQYAICLFQHPVIASSGVDAPTAWKINLTTVCGDPVQDFVINDSDISKIRLQNLTSNTAYTVRVSGINSRGVGIVSEFATAQTRLEIGMLQV